MRAPRVRHDLRCDGCGFDAAAVRDRELATAVRALGDRWVVFVDAVDRQPGGSTLLQTRPRDDGRSALDCECELRDRLRELTARVDERAGRTPDDVFVVDGIEDPDVVVGEIAQCTDEIADVVRRNVADAAVVRLARTALHEGYHHLAAAERSVDAVLAGR